jgi:hypothetical protein
MLRLRIVDKNTEANSTSDEKQKSKRGRPRKDEAGEAEPIVVPKRRSRTAKKTGDEEANTTTTPPVTLPVVVPRNFIVQLKIKSSDLSKIQNHFMTKSQRVGYNEPTSEIPTTTEKPTCDFSEYYTLLNNMEPPLVMTSNEAALPKIPNLYNDITIPILPENVPIKLFDKGMTNVIPSRAFRQTTDILLPLITNDGTWPEKSPYACWNCDTFFSGTPIGIPDPNISHQKEIDGKFYCYGNCCSFECAARYIADHESNLGFWEKYSFLCFIYQNTFHLPPDTKIIIAPPKETLSKYGGTLSYDTYHNISKQDYTVEIYKLPLVPVLLHIGEMYRSTNINNLINKEHEPQPQPQTSFIKIKKFIGIDPTRFSQAQKNIKQKTQNIIQNTSSLDKCWK